MVLEECFKKRKRNQQKEGKGEKVDQNQEKVEGRNQVDSLVGFKVILKLFYNYFLFSNIL